MLKTKQRQNQVMVIQLLNIYLNGSGQQLC